MTITHNGVTKANTLTKKQTCSCCSVSFISFLTFVVPLELFTICLFTVVVAPDDADAEALPVICSIACISLLLGPNSLT